MTDPIDLNALDPRGLIAEAYRIEGITAGQCRSIFLDWVLGLDADIGAASRALAGHYRASRPDHPMTVLLREGADASDKLRPTRRRTGRSA